MSDFHNEFDTYHFIPRNDVDLYLCAGDIDSYPKSYQAWTDAYASVCNLMWVKGNHDYYGQSFTPAKDDVWLKNISGVTVAGATLWTDLPSPEDWYLFQHYMNDASQIHDLTHKAYRETHDAHKKHLFESGADIWLIHHCPSYMSVHPRYAGNVGNMFFATELQTEILALPKPPKLIVHGHTHSEFDYMLGPDTRVICHPRGYPHEQSWFDYYEPKVVDIKFDLL